MVDEGRRVERGRWAPEAAVCLVALATAIAIGGLTGSLLAGLAIEIMIGGVVVLATGVLLRRPETGRGDG